MKQNFTQLLFLFALLLVGTTAWADEVYYTLDGTVTGGSNGYATESEITQGDMTWQVTGNTTVSPWRIGGKNLTNEDRPVYSTTGTSETTSQIDVTLGTKSLTLNSLTLIVASDNNFSTIIDTQTINSPDVSTTHTFTPSTGITWSSGSYIKVIFNVTADSSNQYVQLTKVELYTAGSASTITTPKIEGTTPFLGSTQVSITCTTEDAEIYYTLNGEDPSDESTAYTTPFNIDATTTVKAIAILPTGYKQHCKQDLHRAECLHNAG